MKQWISSDMIILFAPYFQGLLNVTLYQETANSNLSISEKMKVSSCNEGIASGKWKMRSLPLQQFNT